MTGLKIESPFEGEPPRGAITAVRRDRTTSYIEKPSTAAGEQQEDSHGR